MFGLGQDYEQNRYVIHPSPTNGVIQTLLLNTGDWNLQEWKMTDWNKTDDGLEQEQTYNTAYDEKL